MARISAMFLIRVSGHRVTTAPPNIHIFITSFDPFLQGPSVVATLTESQLVPGRSSTMVTSTAA
jgi:hypothetical protein